ncbi:MAG: acetate--CoA ligase family protein [Pseudomonadota bacterium]
MLDGLYRPGAIAVIGASKKTLSIGYRVLANIIDNKFTGPIFPVNPKEDSILDLKAYKSVLDIPQEVDLANISIPAKFVPAAMDECGRKGIKFAIIHTAGFKEVGPEGAKLESTVLEIARKYGMRVYGPNSQGVMNSDPGVSLYANFTFTPMKPGSISILAQSGGVAELLNLKLEEAGAGFRMYGSNGNASDISIDELLEYFGQDEETKAILLYVESFQDPARFVEVASAITPKKPILAIKAGTSAEGAKAITSHTGALMGRDTITDVLFERAGVIRFSRMEELVQAAIAFSRQPLPRGNKVTIVTNAGGPAIQATDEAVSRGMELSALSDGTKAKLRENLNPMSSVNNPVDMTATAGPKEFGGTIRTLLEDPEVHSLLLSMVTPFFVDNEGVVKEVIASLEGALIPTVGMYLTNRKNWGHIIDEAKNAGIPVYDYPETAAMVLSAMSRYVEARGRDRGQVETFDIDKGKAAGIIAGARRDASGFIPLLSAFDVMKSYGIPCCETRRLGGLDELEKAAGDLPFPLALKADIEGVVHKTEAGAVVLGIDGKDSLLAEAGKIADRFKGKKISFIMQPQLEARNEVIMGLSRAGDAGAIVMIGTGGIFTEIMQDAQFRLVPITRPDARDMIKNLKGYGLLAGARGRRPVDFTLLEDMLLRLSQMASEQPGIEEVDLNPVFASADRDKTVAVDVRIKVS